MPESTQTLVDRLRKMLGDYQSTEEDLYVSDEIAEFDPEHMFRYFRGSLDDQRRDEIERFSQESKSFLEDLIGVGKLVLAEEKSSQGSHGSIWSELRKMSIRPESDRLSFLKSTNGVRFELPSASMLAADSGGVEIEAALDFDALVDVYEDDGELIVKLTSQDTNHHGMLVGLCLSDDKSDILAVTILRRGVLDKVTGMVRFNRKELSGTYVLNLTPIELNDLDVADTECLIAGVHSDRDDQRSMEQWRQLVNRLNENGTVELAKQISAALGAQKRTEG